MRIVNYLLIITLSCTLSCKSHSKPPAGTSQAVNPAELQYVVSATYSPYTSAMGKTRGIIFRASVSGITASDFKVDSFYVNNQPLEFTVAPGENKVLKIEANYSKTREEPYANPDGTVVTPAEVEDPVINGRSFYPAWLVLSFDGKKIRYPIKTFNEQY